MKRLSLIVCALLATLSTFAYYDSYGYGGYSSSSSNDSGWAIIVSIIMLIGGILEIILFFKLWGMTNDIKALKKDHFSETKFDGKEEIANYLRKNLVLGNMDNVKRILLQNFIDNVEQGYRDLKSGAFEKDEKGLDVWVSYKNKNMKESIEPYVKNLMLQYAKIGEEVPVYITRMKTFGDYYKLFVAEDLIVKEEKKTEEEKQG